MSNLWVLALGLGGLFLIIGRGQWAGVALILAALLTVFPI